MHHPSFARNHKRLVNLHLKKFCNIQASQQLTSVTKKLYTCARDFVLRDGKRLRPLLARAAHDAISGKQHPVIDKISIAPELLHASTLIHDDIMDEDHQRRGKAALHMQFQKLRPSAVKKGLIFSSPSARFGASQAILAGNILATQAYEVVGNAPLSGEHKMRIISILTKAYRKVNEGQALDIAYAHAKKVSEQQYVAMAAQKTGALFSASLALGAVLKDASQEQLNAVKKFGEHLGVGFQIYDDLKDFSKEKGREQYSDLATGQKSFPIMRALATLPVRKRIRLQKTPRTTQSLRRAAALVEESDALSYSRITAKKHSAAAVSYLDKVSLSPKGKEVLQQIAFSIN